MKPTNSFPNGQPISFEFAQIASPPSLYLHTPTFPFSYICCGVIMIRRRRIPFCFPTFPTFELPETKRLVDQVAITDVKKVSCVKKKSKHLDDVLSILSIIKPSKRHETKDKTEARRFRILFNEFWILDNYLPSTFCILFTEEELIFLVLYSGSFSQFYF